MQVNVENMQGLATQLHLTLGLDAAARTRATEVLKAAEQQQGFALVLLKVVSEEGVPANIRVAGAIYFKNFIMHNWVPDGERDIIAPNDRTVIKQHLVQLMLTAPTSIQAQLSQALGLISKEDFPEKWQELLPALVLRLGENDMGVLSGVLDTAHSIFYRYRHEVKSQRLWEEIKYVLDTFQAPLTEVFKKIVASIEANQSNTVLLPKLFNILNTITEIFFSLSCQDIPAYFEDNMDAWMAPFLFFISYKSPALETKSDEERSPLDKLQASICELAKLYTEKYEEQFQGWVSKFVQSIWALLTTLTDAAKYDDVVTSSIKFLTTVVKKDWSKELFGQGDALKTICEKVVIPQIKLRQSDVELFKEDGTEYIRRDMEGSDIDTRRRTTVDFVRGLCIHFEPQVTEILKGYVGSLLQEYSADPKARWVLKDAAMYIVLALTVRGATKAKGATQTNKYINIVDFFGSQVLPELQRKNVEEVLTADCLKFVTTFRHQLPREAYSVIFPLLIAHLGSEEVVIHTYAASAIEKLLSVKDDNGLLKFGKEQLRPPFGEQLLVGLFQVLDFEESKENEYAMKAIMRVCAVGQETMLPFVQIIVQKVTHLLGEVAKNPRNPMFNHFLFETLSCLVLYVCKGDPSKVSVFEAALFPPFQSMLSMETCVEFMPYVFQIMALMLETRTTVTPAYASIYPALLSPALWDNQGNVPALTRFLRSFLAKASPVTYENKRIEGLLGIFQKVNASKKLDHHGMELLGSIVYNLPLQVVDPYLSEAFKLLFSRLQTRKTPKFVKCLIVFLSTFIIKHDFAAMLRGMDRLQPGIFAMLLEKVWLPNTASITDEVEKKVVGVAMTKMLCASPGMLVEPYLHLWPKALESVVNLFELQAEIGTGEEEDIMDASEKGFKTSYAQLHFAPVPETDPCKEVGDAKELLAKEIANLTRTNPGKFTEAIAQLSPDHQQALSGYMNASKENVQQRRA